MSKYRKLTEHLANLDASEWRAQFSEIEEILEFPLPDSARAYQAWWANQSHSQSRAWRSAGWKTADLDLKNEQVKFIYIAGNDNEDSEPQPVAETSIRLSIAEAKAGLAATFGVAPTQIEITIKG